MRNHHAYPNDNNLKELTWQASSLFNVSIEKIAATPSREGQ
jgi:hypothetical protein